MLKEECTECIWHEYWEGGSASDDPGVRHAKKTGHKVQTSVLPESNAGTNQEPDHD